VAQNQRLQIRQARAADAAALRSLTEHLGYSASLEAIAQRSATLLALDEHSLLVASVGERVCGWIHVFAAHRLEAEDFAEIGGLVVDEASQGQGIATALVEAAESWARSRGLGFIRVRCNVIRAEAHRFYRRRGYASLKQQTVFQRSLEPGE